MKRGLVFVILLCAALPLRAHLDGRIQHKGIPSLTAETGIERTFFLYNAPVHDYISLNFGYGSTRFEFNGLSLGTSFQWLDAESAAGILRLQSLYLLDRSASAFLIGGWGEAGITAGDDRSGFTGAVSGQFLWSTRKQMYATINLRAGVYINPHEQARISLGPGVGRNFITNDTFFFDIILALEVYLWN